MFHEDVVQVVRKRLELEEHLPEAQRPTALARSYYLKVLCTLPFSGCFVNKVVFNVVLNIFLKLQRLFL